MSIEWKGVMPAVTTKFTKDDTLDLQMFQVNIEAQLKAGVSGIIFSWRNARGSQHVNR